MPLPKANTYTTDYIYFLPERQRAELIDGVIYDMTPQSRLHQELVSELNPISALFSKISGTFFDSGPDGNRTRVQKPIPCPSTSLVYP